VEGGRQLAVAGVPEEMAGGWVGGRAGVDNDDNDDDDGGGR
jgi:hypothetical protein